MCLGSTTRRLLLASTVAIGAGVMLAGCSSLAQEARAQARAGAASGVAFVSYIVEKITEESDTAASISEAEIRDRDWTAILDEAERGKDIRHVVITGFESRGPEQLTVTIFIRESATESSGLDAATVNIHGCATVTAEAGAAAVVEDIGCEKWLDAYEWSNSEEVSLASLR